MELKVDHYCDICNKQKTCFVFKEFNSLFTLCTDCFNILSEKAPTAINDVCFLCDMIKETLFEMDRKKSIIEKKTKICSDCKEKLERMIDSVKI